MLNFIKRLYIWSTGYSYTNLGRLFLRLFVGLMLMQFGVRQMYQYLDGDVARSHPGRDDCDRDILLTVHHDRLLHALHDTATLRGYDSG